MAKEEEKEEGKTDSRLQKKDPCCKPRKVNFTKKFRSYIGGIRSA